MLGEAAWSWAPRMEGEQGRTCLSQLCIWGNQQRWRARRK